MFYADQVGLTELAQVLRRIAASPSADSAFWAPAKPLVRLAHEESSFGDFTGAKS